MATNCLMIDLVYLIEVQMCQKWHCYEVNSLYTSDDSVFILLILTQQLLYSYIYIYILFAHSVYEQNGVYIDIHTIFTEHKDRHV